MAPKSSKMLSQKLRFQVRNCIQQCFTEEKSGKRSIELIILLKCMGLISNTLVQQLPLENNTTV